MGPIDSFARGLDEILERVSGGSWSRVLLPVPHLGITRLLNPHKDSHSRAISVGLGIGSWNEMWPRPLNLRYCEVIRISVSVGTSEEVTEEGNQSMRNQKLAHILREAGANLEEYKDRDTSKVLYLIIGKASLVDAVAKLSIVHAPTLAER